MPKKSHHHSIHFSDEVQKLAEANMEKVGITSLNAYIEMLMRKHEEFLRTCAVCRDREVAESVRAVLVAAQRAGPVPWRE